MSPSDTSNNTDVLVIKQVVLRNEVVIVHSDKQVQSRNSK